MATFLPHNSLIRSQGYIGGKWVQTEKTFPVYNPANGEELGQVAEMGPDDARNAVQAAHAALKLWARLTSQVRTNAPFGSEKLQRIRLARES